MSNGRAIISFSKSDYKGVAQTLAQLGKNNDQVIDVLRSALRDHKWDVRQAAIEVLNQLGKSENPVTQDLVKTLLDAEGHAHPVTIEVLGQVERSEKVPIAALMGALSDPQQEVRQSAAKALGQLEKVEDEIINQMVLLLKKEEYNNGERAMPIIHSLMSLLTSGQHYWNKLHDEIHHLNTATQFLIHSEYEHIAKRIFFFSDAPTCRTVPLVCRRWRDLYSEFHEDQVYSPAQISTEALIQNAPTKTTDDQITESEDNSLLKRKSLA